MGMGRMVVEARERRSIEYDWVEGVVGRRRRRWRRMGVLGCGVEEGYSCCCCCWCWMEEENLVERRIEEGVLTMDKLDLDLDLEDLSNDSFHVDMIVIERFDVLLASD